MENSKKPAAPIGFIFGFIFLLIVFTIAIGYVKNHFSSLFQIEEKKEKQAAKKAEKKPESKNFDVLTKTHIQFAGSKTIVGDGAKSTIGDELAQTSGSEKKPLLNEFYKKFMKEFKSNEFLGIGRNPSAASLIKRADILTQLVNKKISEKEARKALSDLLKKETIESVLQEIFGKPSNFLKKFSKLPKAKRVKILCFGIEEFWGKKLSKLNRVEKSQIIEAIQASLKSLKKQKVDKNIIKMMVEVLGHYDLDLLLHDLLRIYIRGGRGNDMIGVGASLGADQVIPWP